ncbi:hypothetical protein [Nocardia spumae]|uniref:hypothetical protein n=1 Tax=Nocardia spumae TaxID=2887190 RepID=UPI001D13B413|nr:hypothetical protein [Nocardia spumae]
MNDEQLGRPQLFSHQDVITDSAPATAARTDLRPVFLAVAEPEARRTREPSHRTETR